MYFASSFFQAALSGDWAETGRPQSISSVITISQPPTVPGERKASERLTETSFTREVIELEPDESDVDIRGETSESDMSDVEKDRDRARQESLEKLQSASSPTKSINTGKHKTLGLDIKSSDRVRRRAKARGPDAVIVLKEEKVRHGIVSAYFSLVNYRVPPVGQHIP